MYAKILRKKSNQWNLYISLIEEEYQKFKETNSLLNIKYKVFENGNTYNVANDRKVELVSKLPSFELKEYSGGVVRRVLGGVFCWRA